MEDTPQQDGHITTDDSHKADSFSPDDIPSDPELPVLDCFQVTIASTMKRSLNCNKI